MSIASTVSMVTDVRGGSLSYLAPEAVGPALRLNEAIAVEPTMDTYSLGLVMQMALAGSHLPITSVEVSIILYTLVP